MIGRPVAFRRRYVRTAEGSRRYELPIGAPIEAHDQPGGGRHRAPETSDGPGPASLPATLRPASQPSPEELAADYRDSAQLTPDEVAIVDAYQGPGLYKRINKRLRIGEQLAGRPAEVAAGLDQVMARHQTSQPLRVYRGMGSFAPADTSPGAVIEDPGFSSSTLSEDVAKEFAGDGVSLDITVPSGFNAVVVNGAVDDPDLGWEKELLLPRGTRYIVLSEEEREGKRWLNVVALPPATGGQQLLSSGSQASGTTATRGSFLVIGRRVRKPSTPSPLAGSPLGSSGARRTGPRVDGGVWFAVRYVRTAAGSRRYGVPIGSPIPTGRRVRNRTMPDGATRLRLTPAQRAVAGRIFGEDSGSNGASNSGGVSLDVDNPTAAVKALDGLASDDLTPGQRRTVRVLRDKISGLTGPANDETSEDARQPTEPDSPQTGVASDIPDVADMPGDPATAPARRDIRIAYDELAPERGRWIGLADLRDRLEATGLSRAEVDAALQDLAVEEGAHVQAEANQKTLTPRDRDAAVRFGGDDRHLLMIEPPFDDQPLMSTQPAHLANTQPEEGAMADTTTIGQPLSFVDSAGDVWVWDAFAVRYVRTAAGSRRYGVPIGSPIPAGKKAGPKESSPTQATPKPASPKPEVKAEPAAPKPKPAPKPAAKPAPKPAAMPEPPPPPTPRGQTAAAKRVAKNYESSAKLTATERKAIRDYSFSAYGDLNSGLRNPPPDEKSAKLSARLDAAASKYTTTEPLTVWRGTGGYNPPANLQPGQILEDNGWSSTAMTSKTAFKGTRMEISVPTGSHGIAVNGALGADNSHAGENEFILPPGTRFQVVSDEMKGSERWLRVVALPPVTAQTTRTQAA